MSIPLFSLVLVIMDVTVAFTFVGICWFVFEHCLCGRLVNWVPVCISAFINLKCYNICSALHSLKTLKKTSRETMDMSHLHDVYVILPLLALSHIFLSIQFCLICV